MQKDVVGDKDEFDVDIIEEELKEEVNQQKPERKNSIDFDIPQIPKIDDPSQDFEHLFGWILNQDKKYVNYFDIDFMIEIGRACGNFK